MNDFMGGQVVYTAEVASGPWSDERNAEARAGASRSLLLVGAVVVADVAASGQICIEGGVRASRGV
jgi:hypothetical protein